MATAALVPQAIGAELPDDEVKRGPGGAESVYGPALKAIEKANVWHVLTTFEKRNSAKGRAAALAKSHAGYEFAVRTVEGKHTLYARKVK